MNASNNTTPTPKPRLSQSPTFTPFRRGDQMTDEVRARLLDALSWKPFVRDLTQLGKEQAELERAS